MKATNNVKRGLLGILGAAILSTALFTCVACTRNDMPNDPKETVSGTAGGTTGGTSSQAPGSGAVDTSDGRPDNRPSTDRPLNPDAGTVTPDNNPGDPPAGTGEDKSFRSRFMH